MPAIRPETQPDPGPSRVPAPPLGLYIHIPWCVRKCPYCDFNSHPQRGGLDQVAYVDALLADLAQEQALARGRSLGSIFIGGGTPSLFSGAAIGRLLAGVRALISWAPDIEITLEANPGAVESGHFAGYRSAGVTRLSLGVQSFEPGCLQRLGRIHSAEEARSGVAKARCAGFDNLNLDLMFGLPGQDLAMARLDLESALELAPEHLSYYQLTLEPNTAFHAHPPALPDDDSSWEIQQQGLALLAAGGFEQYEVSAYARPGRRCRHNLNYWGFGDYLGIGAGAHAKLSLGGGTVERRWKLRDPRAYQAAAVGPERISGRRRLNQADLVLEFMMNALRLNQGFTRVEFEASTGMALATAEPALSRAQAAGLLDLVPGRIRPSELGRRFLNDLLDYFLVD